MESSKIKIITCTIFIIVLTSQVAGEFDGRSSDVEGPRVERMHPETSENCVGNNNCLQNSDAPVGAMWFGPRLGRRRRSDVKLNGKKIEALGELLAQPNWGLISDAKIQSGSTGSTGGDDKRQEAPFTPRLGRELEEALSSYELIRSLLNRVPEETNDKDLQSLQEWPQHVPPPRLGRNLLTPRLEHELRNLLRRLQQQQQQQ